MVVMGRTELTRELATRRLDGWAIRLGLHIHLMPLDLDEARELLAHHGRAGLLAEPALEASHRDALGNPRILLRLAESRGRSNQSLAQGRRPEPSRPPQPAVNPTPRPIEDASAPIRPSVTPEDRKPAGAFLDPLQAPDPPRGRPRRGRLGRR